MRNLIPSVDVTDNELWMRLDDPVFCLVLTELGIKWMDYLSKLNGIQETKFAPVEDYVWQFQDLLQRVNPKGEWITVSILMCEEMAKRAIKQVKEFPNLYAICRITRRWTSG